jgi:dTDP-4-dehydrorhamnose reductase
MLGHKMFQTLRAAYPGTICTIRGQVGDSRHRAIQLLQSGGVVDGLDAMDGRAVCDLLRSVRPHYVVNCIGVIKQRTEARQAIPSITINALLPHLLAEWVSEWRGRLIHFSSDCVFSGRTGDYGEDDPSDAEDLYGRSKYLGEVHADNALTLRTSIIGRELFHFQSLLEWFLAQNGGTVNGYRRVMYSGITTNYLAQLVSNLISTHPRIAGLYQVAGTAISKHDLLCVIKEVYGLSIDIRPVDRPVSDRSLNGSRLRQATGYSCPDWPELVQQMAADLTPYTSWR